MKSSPTENEIAQSIKEAIASTPKKQKRVLLKTLLKQFGWKTRQARYLDLISAAFTEAGILMSPDLKDVGRDDWVYLSVITPDLPVGDFMPPPASPNGEASPPKADDWFDGLALKTFASEKEVEIRFVLPLLERLGFSEDDRADGYPVEQVVGVKKIKTEADFVLFDGRNRTKDAALMVVEAKNVGKKLGDHIQQARSYAMFLGCPYYMVTNAEEVRVYLYRSPIESDVEVFSAERRYLKDTFSTLFNLISKPAILEYRRRRASGPNP